MFKLKRGFLPEVDYEKTYQPKNGKIWSKKLFSEFLGTIYFAYVIGLLGVRMKDGIKFEYLLTGENDEWVSRIVVGLWVAADIAVCLALFSKMSCDLNPAISFYRWFAKENTGAFALSKMGIQMVGAIAAAGLLVLTQYLVQISTNDPLNFVANAGLVTDGRAPHLVANGGLQAAQYSALINYGSVGTALEGGTIGKHFAVLGGEMLGTIILLWAVFNRSMSSHGARIFIIVFLVFLGVSTLVEIQCVGWNPARSLATNAAFDISTGTTSGMEIYWAYFVGPFLGALTLYYGTVFFKRQVSRV